MRKMIGGLILVFFFFHLLIACIPTSDYTNGDGLQGDITVSGAFALYPLMLTWADEFQKAHPAVNFDITSGGGNCGVFGDNELMEGTFSITGDYCDTVTLYITPGGAGAPSHGATPLIVGMGDNKLEYGIDLPDSGYSGTWELNTGPMDPCGYNIWIHGEDRTIVNSNHRGHEAWKPRGFCVMADEEEGI